MLINITYITINIQYINHYIILECCNSISTINYFSFIFKCYQLNVTNKYLISGFNKFKLYIIIIINFLNKAFYCQKIFKFIHSTK